MRTPRMQVPHFDLIADVIANVQGVEPQCRYNIAHDFSHALRRTNPHFNSDRFLRACGVRPDADTLELPL